MTFRAGHGQPGGLVRRMRAVFPEGGNHVSAMSDRSMSAARRPEKGDEEVSEEDKRQEPIRVLIADDHALFRRGLQMVLDEEDDIDLVGQASDGTEAVAVAGESLPDVVLMDIRMPKSSGIEACRATKEVAPSAKIVMLTISDEEEDLFEAIRAGASGYLLKDIPLDEVAEAVRAVHGGQSPDQPLDGGQAAQRVRHAGQPRPEEERPSTSPRRSSPTARWRCSSWSPAV